MYLSKSEIHQLDLLRQKTPLERFLLMTDLINGQFKIMLAGIRYIHPKANKKELTRCLKERMIKIYSLNHKNLDMNHLKKWADELNLNNELKK